MGYLLNPDFLLLAKIPGAMKPINQENGTCDDRPTALVTHNNCTSALDSGITRQSTLSKNGSEILSLLTTSSGHLQLTSMKQQISSVKTMEGCILNEVTKMS